MHTPSTFTRRYSSVLSFIRLADYLIVNTMHVLAVNSVSTLLNYLTEQLQNTPTLAEIQGLEDETKEEEKEKEKDDNVSTLSLVVLVTCNFKTCFSHYFIAVIKLLCFLCSGKKNIFIP